MTLVALSACTAAPPPAAVPASSSSVAPASSPAPPGSSPDAVPSTDAPEPPVDGFVRVPAADIDEPAVDLGYRDYGGGGSPILLLAGLGDTAAVFDELAPLLRSAGHRVVALTRRGFGGSTKASTGYDTNTRTLDDVAAITALGLDHPVVVGHSIASDELVGLATDYADQIGGVVSLDAMLDRSVGGPYDAALECGESVYALAPTLSVDPADPYGSIARHQDLLNGFIAGNGLANIRAQVALTDRDVIPTAEQTAAEQILSAARQAPPDYSGMKARILALFSLPSVEVDFPWLDEVQTSRALLDTVTECTRIGRELTQSSAEDLQSQAADATILTWEGAHHYQFLQWPQRTADAITAWIAGAGSGKSADASSGQS